MKKRKQKQKSGIPKSPSLALQPLPLIRREQGKCVVGTHAAAFLKGIKIPFAVISNNGEERRGKSFFLNHIFPEVSFKVGHTEEKTTVDILISPKLISGENTAALVIDCQGLGNPKSSQLHDSNIMLISSLVSTDFLYHHSGTITRELFRQLAIVLTLGERVRARAETSSSSSFSSSSPSFSSPATSEEKGELAETETSDSAASPDGFQLSKFRDLVPYLPPRFMLLCRDWCRDLSSAVSSPDEYFENSLKDETREEGGGPEDDHLWREQVKVKKAFKACFRERHCNFIHRPVLQEELLSKVETFSEMDSRWNPTFLAEAQEFKESLLKNLTPKKLGGKMINGEQLLTWLHQICDCLNTSKTPILEEQMEELGRLGKEQNEEIRKSICEQGIAFCSNIAKEQAKGVVFLHTHLDQVLVRLQQTLSHQLQSRLAEGFGNFLQEEVVKAGLLLEQDLRPHFEHLLMANRNLVLGQAEQDLINLTTTAHSEIAKFPLSRLYTSLNLEDLMQENLGGQASSIMGKRHSFLNSTSPLSGSSLSTSSTSNTLSASSPSSFSFSSSSSSSASSSPSSSLSSSLPSAALSSSPSSPPSRSGGKRKTVGENKKQGKEEREEKSSPKKRRGEYREKDKNFPRDKERERGNEKEKEKEKEKDGGRKTNLQRERERERERERDKDKDRDKQVPVLQKDNPNQKVKALAKTNLFRIMNSYHTMYAHFQARSINFFRQVFSKDLIGDDPLFASPFPESKELDPQGLFLQIHCSQTFTLYWNAVSFAKEFNPVIEWMSSLWERMSEGVKEMAVRQKQNFLKACEKIGDEVAEERKRVQLELRRQTEHAENLSHEMKDRDQRLEALCSSLKKKEKEADEMHNQLEEMQLKSELTEAELTTQLEETKKRERELKQHVAKGLSAYSALENREMSLKAENEKLYQALTHAEARCKKLGTDLEEGEREKEKLLEELQEKKDEFKENKDSLERRMEHRLAELEDTMRQKERELEAKKAENQKMAMDLKAAQSELGVVQAAAENKDREHNKKFRLLELKYHSAQKTVKQIKEKETAAREESNFYQSQQQQQSSQLLHHHLPPKNGHFLALPYHVGGGGGMGSMNSFSSGTQLGFGTSNLSRGFPGSAFNTTPLSFSPSPSSLFSGSSSMLSQEGTGTASATGLRGAGGGGSGGGSGGFIFPTSPATTSSGKPAS